MFFNVFDTNLAILYVQHVDFTRTTLLSSLGNTNVYLFIRFEMNVFSL